MVLLMREDHGASAKTIDRQSGCYELLYTTLHSKLLNLCYRASYLLTFFLFTVAAKQWDERTSEIEIISRSLQEIISTQLIN